MSRHSVFLDRGEEVALFFPSERVEDRRGNLVRRVTEDPVPVRVSEIRDRSSIPELPGQVDATIFKVVARNLPVGTSSWDRIVWRDTEWDMAVPPIQIGFTRANRHWHIILRSRNRKVGDG